MQAQSHGFVLHLQRNTRIWHPPPCTQGNLSPGFSHLRFAAFSSGHLRNLPHSQSNQSTHPSHCFSYHLGGGARASDHKQIKKNSFEPPPLCPHLNPAPACYWTDLVMSGYTQAWLSSLICHFESVCQLSNHKCKTTQTGKPLHFSR